MRGRRHAKPLVHLDRANKAKVLAVSLPAGVARHLSTRYGTLTDSFLDWRSAVEAGESAGDVVQDYMESANIGDVARVGTGSVVTRRDRAPQGAPTVVVIGTHDVDRLVPNRRTGPAAPVAAFRGPGVASMLGPIASFIEGFRTTILDVLDEPLNIAVASLDPRDAAAEVYDELGLETVDTILLTDAVNWQPQAPTLTVGTRGRIQAEITVAAPAAVDDRAYAGAGHNPLNRLVQLLAGLRDDKGRIVLDGFYDRAEPPIRGELGSGVELDSAWSETLGVAVGSGRLDPLERATRWPVVSVLDVNAEPAPPGATPERATARVALHLVPHQRPAEIERSLRAWVDARLPDTLMGHTRIVATSRPYRLDGDEPVVAAQMRAIRRVSGTNPTLIGAGGTIGAGELHYRTGAPVAFAGIAGPAQGWGTSRELLPHAIFDLAVATAAETCVQLRRRSAVRSTP